MNFVQQLVELTLGGEPLPDFLHQILGDVNGAGTTVVFEGELVGSMFGTAVMAAAGRGAADAVNQAQGTGEERTGEGQALEARLEHTAYQGGMVRDAHGQPPRRTPGAGTETSVSWKEENGQVREEERPGLLIGRTSPQHPRGGNRPATASLGANKNQFLRPGPGPTVGPP